LDLVPQLVHASDVLVFDLIHLPVTEQADSSLGVLLPLPGDRGGEGADAVAPVASSCGSRGEEELLGQGGNEVEEEVMLLLL
jgi:hypothetical protein